MKHIRIETQLISDGNEEKFGEMINEYLDNLFDDGNKVVDIKFSSVICANGMEYSALIIYEGEEIE